MVGGGAYPTYKIPGYGIQIDFREKQLEKIARQLREMTPALLTRKQEDKMLISVRTLLEGDVAMVLEIMSKVLLEEVDQETEPGENL